MWTKYLKDKKMDKYTIKDLNDLVKVCYNEKIKIIVNQIPEQVITVKIKENNQNIAILLGHIIGNRHRPIQIKDETIVFPIQENSELEIFQRLFKEIIGQIELKIEKTIFLPHTSADVHEH